MWETGKKDSLVYYSYPCVLINDESFKKRSGPLLSAYSRVIVTVVKYQRRLRNQKIESCLLCGLIFTH